jgi:hypothetical protein
VGLEAAQVADVFSKYAQRYSARAVHDPCSLLGPRAVAGRRRLLQRACLGGPTLAAVHASPLEAGSTMC